MFDTTATGRLLAAALDLAGRKSWADVRLRDIAQAADVTLAELRATFVSKAALIAALIATIDGELLRKAPKSSEGEDPRDRLFDAIMTRFDILAPHKLALRSIYASGAVDLTLARPYLTSQYWMLETAGIPTEGATGALRIAG